MMGSIYERDAFLRGEAKGRASGIRILEQTLRRLGHSEEEIEALVRENYSESEGEVLVAQEEKVEYKAKRM